MFNSTIDQALLKDAAAMQQTMMRLSWVSRRRLANEVENYGLTVPQFITLRALHSSSEGLTMSALAEACYQISATMTGVVDRLAERNLVQRQRSLDDRRVLVVTLTGEGKQMMEQIENRQIERVARIFQALPANERKELLRIMARYLENILAEIHNDKEVFYTEMDQSNNI